MTSEYFYPQLRNGFRIFLSAVLVVLDIFICNRHLTCRYFFSEMLLLTHYLSKRSLHWTSVHNNECNLLFCTLKQSFTTTMNFLYLTIHYFSKWRREGHNWSFKNLSGASYNSSGAGSNCLTYIEDKNSNITYIFEQKICVMDYVRLMGFLAHSFFFLFFYISFFHQHIFLSVLHSIFLKFFYFFLLNFFLSQSGS